MISVEMLGQACVAIRAGDRELISDPWVLRAAQVGAWQPYPGLSERERDAQRARIDRATDIYISHDHADHFDPALLSLLSPKRILVATFHNSTFRSALQALAKDCGHTLVELAPGQRSELSAEVTLRIIPEQPRFRTNSMLLVSTPVGAILNANDCGVNSAVLAGIAKRQRVRLFLYTLNFMANGYPFPYLRSDDPQLLARIDEVRAQVVESFRLAMKTLQPDLSVAFAGPVVFPDRCNEHLNRHPQALDWRPMIEELAAVGPVAWLTPRSRVHIEGESLRLEHAGSWDELLASHPRPASTREGPTEPLRREHFLQAAHTFLARVGAAVARSGQRVRVPIYLCAVPSSAALESSEYLGVLRIDLDQLSEPVWVERCDAPYLRIVSTPELLTGFLQGRYTLDELLLSALARFAREPDVFNGTLHNFLRFGHDADAIEELLSWYERNAQSRAVMERVVDGRRYTLPKFCPHEGESLELASIDNGRLVCPRHQWCFELESGDCVAVGDPALNLYRNLRVS